MIYKLQNGKVIKRQIKNTALEKQAKGYMAEGGRLFKTGGLSGPINPNILRQAVKQMLLRAVPRNILVGAADLADEVAGIPSFQQIKEIPKVGKFYTDALDNRESEYYEDGYIENPGLTFLLDLGRQSKMLQKMGYHPVNDGYYGSVTSATRKLNALKGYAIPIFQKGDDEVDFSEVEPIADKDGNYFFERTSYLGDIFGKNELNHASYHPVSFYRHKRTGDIYVRGYDLNDYGKHNKNMWKHLPEALGNSLFNEGYSYDKTGQTYGDEQYLAEIYDYIGNPFVQRTALIKAPEKLVKKYFGDNYASGGKIHIKSENRRKLFEEGGPDGIDLHKNGGIIKLQKGKVLPIIRKIAKPISEAERLGIPKALRSSPKALEDPYYWGYQQWNSRYNAAVNSRNLQEAQRLRDLHFKIKAPDTKVIDEYGMPLHLYHGTGKKNITAFDITKRGFNTGSGYYIDPITNEKIPIDSENTFSFSSSKNTATSYRNLARWQEIEQRMKYYDNIDAALNNKKYSWHVLDDKERQLQREFIDNILSPKLGYDLRKALNFKTLSAEQVQKLNAQIKALRMKMKDIPDMRAISNQRNNLSRDISNLDIIKRNKDKILSGESIPDWDFDNYDLSFISGYGNRDNGDVYEILSKDTEKGGYKINGSSVTKETLNTFIENAEKAISKNRASLEEGERLGGYDDFGDIIDVYANIKNPLIHDYNYSAFPDKYVIPTDKTHKDAMRYGYSTQFVRPLIINGKQVPTGYVAARQVRKAMNSGNDGVIYKNVVDPFLSDTYGIFDPRMVKFSSAITKTDAGEIIPIVKRDNFHSTDMRYKKGGKI